MGKALMPDLSVLNTKAENACMYSLGFMLWSWMTRPEGVQLILLFSFLNMFFSTKPQTEIRILWIMVSFHV